MPITTSAKICPVCVPHWRENEIRARLHAFSISSTESRRMSGLRRVNTPNSPMPNTIADTAMKYSTPTFISRRLRARPRPRAG